MSNVIVINPFMQGGASAPLWTPAELTTALWLDADDAATITESSGAVSQWDDKSGNSRNFTGAGATQPTYTAAGLNSKAVLDFAGDYLTSASAASTWTFLHDATGSSTFAVVKFGDSADPGVEYALLGTGAGTVNNPGLSLSYEDRSVIEGASDALGVRVADGAGNKVVWEFNFVGANEITPSYNNLATPNTYQVVGWLSDPGATAALRGRIAVDGAALAGENIFTSSPSPSAPTYTLQIGARGNNSLPLTGGIAEVVIVSGLISAADRQRMEGYLAHKWGLAGNLPLDHLFASSPPIA